MTTKLKIRDWGLFWCILPVITFIAGILLGEYTVGYNQQPALVEQHQWNKWGDVIEHHEYGSSNFFIQVRTDETGRAEIRTIPITK